MVLREPWRAVEDGGSLVAELAREIVPGHALHGTRVRAIAQRDDTDDVLFEVHAIAPAATDGRARYAVVHLTWSGRAENLPGFPWTSVYDSLEAWGRAEP